LNENVDVTGRGLSFLARQSYLNGDYQNLAMVSDRLMNLNDSYEDVGLYYKSLCLSRQGEGEMKPAYKNFSDLANSPHKEIRAAALLALGMKELRQAKYYEAGRLFLQSNQLAQSDGICAPCILIYSNSGLSLIQSKYEAFAESIKTLQTVTPIVQHLSRWFPALSAYYYNNFACGYLDIGELETARYYSQRSLQIKSPVTLQERLETKEVIDSKFTEKTSKSAIAFQAYNAPAGDNLVQFPAPKKRLKLYLQYYKSKYKILDFDFEPIDENIIRLRYLFYRLNRLSAKNSTPIIVYGIFSSPGYEDFEYTIHIDRDRLKGFFTIIKDFRFNRSLTQLSNSYRKILNDENVSNLTKWLKAK
jgi:tetratricopeptide (TPR) repeat protein